MIAIGFAAGLLTAFSSFFRVAGASGESPDPQPELGPLAIFPTDNPWNQPVDKLPVHPNSQRLVESIGLDRPLHPDFGTVYNGAPNGIPYSVVSGEQPKVPIEFEYGHESDPGPYPIPANAPVEGGPRAAGDRHVIVIDAENKKLYELYNAFPLETGWRAGSGAIFDLTSNKLRPPGWTSADGAGLPIFAGLVRYDEVVKQGEIRHALRFTCRRTRRAYIPPATHFASRLTDSNLPPMGLRLRLRADFDDSPFPPQARVIVRALKKYGLILADNGSDWFISGAPHPQWDDHDLHSLKRIKGREFEAVTTGDVVAP
jgi:hypothetical protein